MIKKISVLVLALCVLSQSCYATAPAPVYTGTMNNKIAQIVSAKAVQKGFAANDPRVQNTTNAASVVISAATGAFGLLLAVGSPIRWIETIGKILGVASSIMAIYQGYEWAFGSDGTVTAQGSAVTGGTPTAPVTSGTSGMADTGNVNGLNNFGAADGLWSGVNVSTAFQSYAGNSSCTYLGDDALFQTCILSELAVGKIWYAETYNSYETGDQFEQIVVAAPTFGTPFSTLATSGANAGKYIRQFPFTITSTYGFCRTTNPDYPSCTVADLVGGQYTADPSKATNTASASISVVDLAGGCADGLVMTGSECATSVGSGTSSPVAPNVAADNLASAAAANPTIAAQPLDPTTAANFLNNVLSNIPYGSSGYQGFNPSALGPITPSDVSSLSSPITVGDVLAATGTATANSTGASVPVVMPDTSSAVSPTVASSAPPSTVTNPATGDQVNLGADPNISAPALETTPTAYQILSPLMGLFPALKSFTVPSHGDTCPTATFNLFGGTQTMDAQCTIAEDIRSPLSAVMTAFWAIAAILVILTA